MFRLKKMTHQQISDFCVNYRGELMGKHQIHWILTCLLVRVMIEQQLLRKVGLPIATYRFSCYLCHLWPVINLYISHSRLLFVDHFDLVDGFYEYKYGSCHSDGQMALAILLTMLLTAGFTLMMKWCFNRRRRRYHKPGTDIAPLAMDEQ